MSAVSSFLQVMRKILVPLLKPALVYAWIWMALLCYRELTMASVLVTSQNNVTLPMIVWGLWLGGSLNQAAAANLVVLAFMLPRRAALFHLRPAQPGFGGRCDFDFRLVQKFSHRRSRGGGTASDRSGSRPRRIFRVCSGRAARERRHCCAASPASKSQMKEKSRSTARLVFSRSRRVCAAPEEREIGMVFQSYAIWPHLTVAENIGLVLTHGRSRHVEEKRRWSGFADSLDLVQLENFEDRPARLLSGGQQQRVALARALAVNPALLVDGRAVEQSGCATAEKKCAANIKKLATQLGITVLYVTHDQVEAMVLADRIAVMAQGRFCRSATLSTFIAVPANALVAEFFGSINWIRGKMLDANHVNTECGVLCMDDSRRCDGAVIVVSGRKTSAWSDVLGERVPVAVCPSLTVQRALRSRGPVTRPTRPQATPYAQPGHPAAARSTVRRQPPRAELDPAARHAGGGARRTGQPRSATSSYWPCTGGRSGRAATTWSWAGAACSSRRTASSPGHRTRSPWSRAGAAGFPGAADDADPASIGALLLASGCRQVLATTGELGDCVLASRFVESVIRGLLDHDGPTAVHRAVGGYGRPDIRGGSILPWAPLQAYGTFLEGNHDQGDRMTNAVELPYERSARNAYEWTDKAFDELGTGLLQAHVHRRDGMQSAVVTGACPRCGHTFHYTTSPDAIGTGGGTRTLGPPCRRRPRRPMSSWRSTCRAGARAAMPVANPMNTGAASCSASRCGRTCTVADPTRFRRPAPDRVPIWPPCRSN